MPDEDGLRSDELIAVFDADFVPPPDFLVRTVPFLLANPAAGLVQSGVPTAREHASLARSGFARRAEWPTMALKSVGAMAATKLQQISRAMVVDP